jgi:hypothetical protein
LSPCENAYPSICIIIVSDSSDIVVYLLIRLDSSILQFLRLSELQTPDSIPISDLRRWIGDIAKGNSPVLDFLNSEVEGDLASLASGQSPRTRTYKLVENLTWKFFTTVSGRAENSPVRTNSDSPQLEDEKSSCRMEDHCMYLTIG